MDTVLEDPGGSAGVQELDIDPVVVVDDDGVPRTGGVRQGNHVVCKGLVPGALGAGEVCDRATSANGGKGCRQGPRREDPGPRAGSPPRPRDEAVGPHAGECGPERRQPEAA